ncbi:MAG TPA: YceD family protein [Pedococcus sp.]
MDHLNPRSPLVFDTTSLGRRPGSMEQVQRTVEAPADLGTDVIAVPAGAPVELELRLESVVEGVLVTGSARATATGACVRCLDPVDHEVDVRFQELFAYADRAAHHHEVAPDEDETEEHTLAGDLFDLEPVLRDAVVPALPFQPVCREDCPGLCSECGAHLADDPQHHHDVIDPRWSALSALSSVDVTDDHPSNTNEMRN